MIYLDYAAGTPVAERAWEVMRRYAMEDFFNPSAAYLPAVRVRREYEAAKDRIARLIGGKGADLVMTAGATESINLAFRCAGGGKVLVSGVEHAAVMANARAVGGCEVIKVDEVGRVDLEDLRRKVDGGVRLVSVGLASGELGTIQPIADVAEVVRAERRRRLMVGEMRPIYLHCDASQGLGLWQVKVNRLGVDMLSLNAAKVYGPKGVGALWVGRGVKLEPVVMGGGQERGLRSGTENVAGVMGFAVAAEEAVRKMGAERKRLAGLREILREVLSGDVEIRFLGDLKFQLANYLPIVVPGVDAERVIFKLEREGILVGTGAACSASKGVKSAALRAIGLGDEEIAGSLRITLGGGNTEEEMRVAGAAILWAVAEERARVNGVSVIGGDVVRKIRGGE